VLIPAANFNNGMNTCSGVIEIGLGQWVVLILREGVQYKGCSFFSGTDFGVICRLRIIGEYES